MTDVFPRFARHSGLRRNDDALRNGFDVALKFSGQLPEKRGDTSALKTHVAAGEGTHPREIEDALSQCHRAYGAFIALAR
jgi:hypothetical protein